MGEIGVVENRPEPTGVARRRRRLTDAETEQRMLQAAIDMVLSAGLTVSLEHISLEDVIRDAGVARSAVYRRWPYKDLFFSDLLKELAKGATPAITGDNVTAIEAVKRTVLERLDWLKTPEGRLAMAGEVMRQGALAEVETFLGSAEWRTYLALHATFLGLPDGELRNEVQASLTESEHSLTTRIAASYAGLTGLLGLRLRPDLGVTFELVATLASALIRGLVVMAPANPGIGGHRVEVSPFGAPEPAIWSAPALGQAAMVMTFLEVDPDVDWNDERIELVRKTLTEPGGWPQT